MSPSHVYWNAFLRLLDKKLLHQDKHCAGDFRYTQEALTEVGDNLDADGTIENLRECGVTCDCEIFQLVCFCTCLEATPSPFLFWRRDKDHANKSSTSASRKS